MDLVELTRSGENKGRHPWELSRAQIAIKKLYDMNIPEGTTVLDVGCGDIYFIKRLSQEFPKNKFIGVDIAFTPAIINQLTKELPKNVSIVTNMDEIDFTNHIISVVLLMDVIEHVPDDKALLMDIVKKTRKGHNNEIKFLITVPAYQWLFSAHDVFLGHYRRYTLSHLRSVLKDAGMNVNTCGYFFFSLYLARIGVKILESLKLIGQDAKGIADYKGGNLKTQFIKGVLILDFQVSNFINKIGINLPGLTCFATCTKQLS